ncbi:hypothetical protein BJ508DRAFT_415904 [Ascobolus immersus RN42]|uniref:Uncharacterized protein n=1 Tax=Ascobolus immersus RN42 TaxID=1160509 RepID=A0A3N4I1X5_ASCIM|nr:hypothetical protein BJ508DRAFT_415904 [Ascobolus immersus RN42]
MQTRRRSSVANSSQNQQEHTSNTASPERLVTSSGRTSVPTAKAAAQSPLRGRAAIHHRKGPENQPNDDQPQQQQPSPAPIEQPRLPPTGSGKIRILGKNSAMMNSLDDESASTTNSISASSDIGREQTETPDTPHGSPLAAPLANNQVIPAKRPAESDAINESTPNNTGEPQPESATGTPAPSRASEDPSATGDMANKRPRLDAEPEAIPAGTTVRIVRRVPMLSAPNPNAPAVAYSPSPPVAPTPPPFGGFGTPQSQFAPTPTPPARPTPSPLPTSRSAASSFTDRTARFIKPTLPTSARTPLSQRNDNALPPSSFFDFDEGETPSFLKQSQMGHIAPRMKERTPPPMPVKAPIVIPPLPPIPDEPVRVPPTEEQKERRLKFLHELRAKNYPLRERRAIFLQQIKDQFGTCPAKLEEIHLIAKGYLRGAPYKLMREKIMELLVLPPPEEKPIITCLPAEWAVPKPVIPLKDFQDVFPDERQLKRVMRGLTCSKVDKDKLAVIWDGVEKKRREWERPYVYVAPKVEVPEEKTEAEKEKEGEQQEEKDKEQQKEGENPPEAEKAPSPQLEQQQFTQQDTTMTDFHHHQHSSQQDILMTDQPLMTNNTTLDNSLHFSTNPLDTEMGMSFTDLLMERTPTPPPPPPTAEELAAQAALEAAEAEQRRWIEVIEHAERTKAAALEAQERARIEAEEAAARAIKEAEEAKAQKEQAIRDFYEDTVELSYDLPSIKAYIDFLLKIPTPGVIWGTRTLLDYAIDLFSFEAAVLRVMRDVAGPKKKKTNLEFVEVDIDLGPVKYSEEREEEVPGRRGAASSLATGASGSGGRGTPRGGSARGTPEVTAHAPRRGRPPAVKAN